MAFCDWLRHKREREKMREMARTGHEERCVICTPKKSNNNKLKNVRLQTKYEGCP